MARMLILLSLSIVFYSMRLMYVDFFVSLNDSIKSDNLIDGSETITNLHSPWIYVRKALNWILSCVLFYCICF